MSQGNRLLCFGTVKQFWRMDCGCGSRGTMVPSWQELEEQTFPQTGEDSFYQLVKNLQWEEHRTGSATPAVQRGSVPRRLFFAAQQRIAITWKPK